MHGVQCPRVSHVTRAAEGVSALQEAYSFSRRPRLASPDENTSVSKRPCSFGFRKEPTVTISCTDINDVCSIFFFQPWFFFLLPQEVFNILPTVGRWKTCAIITAKYARIKKKNSALPANCAWVLSRCPIYKMCFLPCYWMKRLANILAE